MRHFLSQYEYLFANFRCNIKIGNEKIVRKILGLIVTEPKRKSPYEKLMEKASVYKEGVI